jgi:putative restriction endonuclease
MPDMTKAVFISKVNSIYDDLPEERYHFPKQYRRRIEATLGDWIIYYEPRRNDGRQVYYATAQVADVYEDISKSGYFYAKIDHYLEFERPVPFTEGGHYYETSLLNPDGSMNPGRAQSAVHHITEKEYQRILQAGFTHVLGLSAGDAFEQDSHVPGLREDQVPFERSIVQQIVNRPFRDHAFAEVVKAAYNKTCAFTGLRIINGGGRPEVQAAHIRPVNAHGPDSVRNGIALCGTVHWMFDRGLISLTDDYKIIKACHKIPEAMNRLLLPSGQMSLPDRQDYFPGAQYLQYHRECIFKG